MTTSGAKKQFLPPGLVSNLQEVLENRKGRQENGASSSESNDNEENASETVGPLSSTSDSGVAEEFDSSKPVVLVTNGEGIESPGLKFLVEALVRLARYNIYVCAPRSDKSFCGHSITIRETVSVTSTAMDGATAYEVSGTPADCVSLALSGALFSWSKPLLVISGINRGSSCGHQMFYSGVVAGGREALISGVPSISISLNWKKDESCDSHFKEAAEICLPLIYAALRDIEKGAYPRDCLLNIDIPTRPSVHKGFKVTRQSMSRLLASWQAVTSQRHLSGQFMSREQSLGIQLAQLGRAASAAGAARRHMSGKKNVEVESVAVTKPGKPESQNGVIKKYFRVQFSEHECGEKDDELDSGTLEEGFVTVTPLGLTSNVDVETRTSTAAWLDTVLSLKSPEGV